MKLPAQCRHHRAVSRIIVDLKHVFTAARVHQAYGKPIEAARVLREGCLQAASAAEKVKP